MPITNQHGFIIGGVPQSGKSSLSRRLRDKFGATIVLVDAIVSSMNDAFPQLGITHFTSSPRTVWKRLAPFIQALAKHMKSEGMNFTIEGYHVSPEIASVLHKRSFKCVFLGYIGVDVDAKISDIRTHAVPDHWTSSLPDHELGNLVIRYQEESREIQAECLRLGVPFVQANDVFSAVEQALVEVGANT